MRPGFEVAIDLVSIFLLSEIEWARRVRRKPHIGPPACPGTSLPSVTSILVCAMAESLSCSSLDPGGWFNYLFAVQVDDSQWHFMSKFAP